MLFPGGFAAMFTSDPQLMEYTRTALRIYMAAVFLMGIQMACQMTFNALGKATEYEKIYSSDSAYLHYAVDLKE